MVKGTRGGAPPSGELSALAATGSERRRGEREGEAPPDGLAAAERRVEPEEGVAIGARMQVVQP
ncbi:MAG: hypothetical protein ACK55E_07305 [Cyanobacteriota bacterium]